jgi:hypothetical protein
MTNKIITAYLENEPKFKGISEKCNQLRDVQNRRNKELERVVHLYTIIFRNLSSRRKPLYKMPGTDRTYISTPTGISIKSPYSINSDSLLSKTPQDLVQELSNLAKFGKAEIKKVLTKEKAKIFFGFVKEVRLLKIKEPIYIDVDKKFYEIDTRSAGKGNLSKEFQLTRVSFDSKTFSVILNLKETNPRHIPLSYFSLEYGAYIEQVLPELNKLIDMAIKERMKETTNIIKFIEYCKEKFENQLVLEELSAKPTSNI